MSGLLQKNKWAVGVVIPARNEEDTIARCVDSVISSWRSSSRSELIWIVVVADDCADRTAERARQNLGQNGQVVECAVRSPGSARRLGVTAVLEHFRGVPARQIWLANTDADGYVPEGWLDTHLYHADHDATGVAGIVELDLRGVRREVSDYFGSAYRILRDGTHPHVHGANFGVRADAYLDVGGWSDAVVAEDHCLWGRLQRRGWALQSPASSVVMTSGRLVGRAVGGFADTLRREVYG